MARTSGPVEKQGLFLAGHSALDFLNTVKRTPSGMEDFFTRDEDVLIWLRQAGMPPGGNKEVRPSGALLRSAQALRAVIRTLVEARKAGKTPDLSDLNAYLISALSHPQLSWTSSKALSMKEVRPYDTPEQVLAPVALKAADLLANADWRRVRKCADSTCVLWFYDLTKPGHRRWCSMASCGNRVKVRTYRNSQKSS